MTINKNGRFDSEAYIDILDNTVIPYIEEEFRYEDIYYYQDNSPIHRSRIVTNWFEDNFAPGQLIRTPAKSFDINPIENVWGRHKVRVANDGLYQTEGELWLAISEVWNDIRENNEEFSFNLVDSIPRRLQAVIASNGGHTKY